MNLKIKRKGNRGKSPPRFYAAEKKLKYLLFQHLTSTVPQLLIASPVELNFTSLSTKNVFAAMIKFSSDRF